MEKIVVRGTEKEVITVMEEKGYYMEGFNAVSISAGYFYAFRSDYQGADYFTISIRKGIYTLSQY